MKLVGNVTILKESIKVQTDYITNKVKFMKFSMKSLGEEKCTYQDVIAFGDQAAYICDKIFNTSEENGFFIEAFSKNDKFSKVISIYKVSEVDDTIEGLFLVGNVTVKNIDVRKDKFGKLYAKCLIYSSFRKEKLGKTIWINDTYNVVAFGAEARYIIGKLYHSNEKKFLKMNITCTINDYIENKKSYKIVEAREKYDYLTESN